MTGEATVGAVLLLASALCLMGCGREPKGASAPSQAEQAAEIAALIEDLEDDRPERHMKAHLRLTGIGDPAIPHLVEALHDERGVLRRSALQILAEIAPGDAGPHLIAATQDPDKDVRAYAASALGKSGRPDQTALATLTEMLLDPEPEVVANAIQALDSLGDTSYRGRSDVVDMLCTHLADPQRGAWAAIALARLGGDRACRALVAEPARPDATDDERLSISHMVGRIGSGAAVPPLVAVLTDGTNEQNARMVAALTLQRLADPSATGDLLRLTHSRELWLRAAAVESLGFRGNAGAVERLIEVASDPGEGPSVKALAIKSLGAIGDARGVVAIAEVMSTDTGSLRLEAVDALRAMPDEVAVRHLRPLLEESDPAVVTHAVRSLARAGSVGTAEELLRLLEREDVLWPVVDGVSRGGRGNQVLTTNIATEVHSSTWSARRACP